MKLNRIQKRMLRAYADFNDEHYRYPLYANCARASTGFALHRRGLLDMKTEPWDWAKFRINAAGRKAVAELDKE